VWSGAIPGAEVVTPIDVGVVTNDMLEELLYFGLDPILIADLGAFMRKRERATDGTLANPVPPESMADYPNLWSFLADSLWDDGQARLTGSATLFWDQARLKVAYNDRDAGEVGFLTLDQEPELLAQMEQALRDDRIDWRKSGRSGRSSR
jgi:hypothetical protein